jgi:hypothetical protein
MGRLRIVLFVEDLDAADLAAVKTKVKAFVAANANVVLGELEYVDMEQPAPDGGAA